MERVGSVAVSGIQRGEQRESEPDVYGRTGGGKRDDHHRRGGRVRQARVAR